MRSSQYGSYFSRKRLLRGFAFLYPSVGENIYHSHLEERGFIVMGNEGKGISPEIEQFVSRKLTIPSFADGTYSTESLNVGVATGIILSEFKRKQI